MKTRNEEQTVDVYVEINGIEHACGRQFPLSWAKENYIIFDKDNQLVRVSRMWPVAVYKESDNVFIAAIVEGDFGKAEIDSLIYDPFQILIPTSREKFEK